MTIIITSHADVCVPLSSFQVLNEVVIDRGQSAYLSNLEIYCNGRQITDVQGDGKYGCNCIVLAVEQCTGTWFCNHDFCPQGVFRSSM